MGFTGLKKKSAIQSLEKQLKKLKSNDLVPTKIEKIGVLANSRLFGSYDITRNLRQKLGISEQKRIEIIIYENVKDDFVTQHYSTFTDKDFGMYGKAKGSVVGFVAGNYDLLINYCNHESVYTNLIALQTKAKFKVGFFDETMQSVYDFTIDIEGNKVDIFNDELAKYLKILKLV